MKKLKLLFVILTVLALAVCLASCKDGNGEQSTDAVSSDQAPQGSIEQAPSAELEEGAIYRITVNEEEKLEKGALTADKFGIEDNSMVKVDMFGNHMSQLWRAYKNEDGTYQLENMASLMRLSVRNVESYQKEKKLSVCLDGTNDVAKNWKILTLDGTLNSCVLINTHTGNAATGYASSNTNTKFAQQGKYEDAATQKWTFKKESDGKGEYPYLLVLKGDYSGASSCPEIIYHDGVYYNYNMTGPIALKTSTDLITWTRHPDMYALSSRPSWMSAVSGGTSIWAPGAYKIGDKYYLYYCTSSSGSQNSGIGVAVSTDPSKNDWKDLGMVIRSKKGDPYNCIDPNVFIDTDGTPYLIWGSYWTGIYMRKLDASTGMLDQNDTTMYHLAKGNSDMEAPYLIKHGDYYYLFTARGGLKKGTYYWAVGRSKTLTGPFVDDRGFKLLDGGGTRLTEWKNGIEGVAHAQYFTAPDGTAYMVSESWENRASDESETTTPVRLHISKIVWTDDGWPVTVLDKDVLHALGE